MMTIACILLAVFLAAIPICACILNARHKTPEQEMRERQEQFDALNGGRK